MSTYIASFRARLNSADLSSRLASIVRIFPKGRPENIFAVLGLIFGIAFVFIIPPGQAPDEHYHFYRAFNISEGRFLGTNQGSYCGDLLPANLLAVAETFQPLAFHREVKTTKARLISLASIPLEPTNRRPAAFCNAIAYLPVIHLPQSIGIFIGRLLRLPPLLLSYAGRLVNCIVGLLLTYLAIRSIPVLKYGLLLLAMMPMTVFLRSTMSGDVITIGLAHLVSATLIRWALEADAVRKSDLVITGILSIMLIASKFAYYPLTLLTLVVPAKIFGGGARKLAFFFCISAIGLGLIFAWTHSIGGLVVSNHQQPLIERALVIINKPQDFISMAWYTAKISWWPWLVMRIGVLGWLDTGLPIGLLYSCLTAIGVVVILDGYAEVRLPIQVRLLAVFIFGVTVLDIFAGLFITTSAGPFIQGFQGRYLIPLDVVILLMMAHRSPWKLELRPVVGLLVSLFISYSLLVTGWVLQSRYYG